MMCLFKPNTYDPKDWQCPKPSCRTVNFKKRSTCISCGARKLEGPHRPLDDWRDGEKHQPSPWDCDSCNAKNEASAFCCIQCKNPSQEMAKMIEEEKSRRAAEEGRGGGLYERQDPSDKKEWDSDGEEFDEFGRRKRKQRRATEPGANGGSGPESASAGSGATVALKGVPGLANKHKAALERLQAKHTLSAGVARNERSSHDGQNGRRSPNRRSRSRSRRSRRRHH